MAPSMSDPSGEAPRPGSGARIALSGMADDRELLRTAAELTRDLHKPNPWIYWPDCLGSAALGYAAVAGVAMLNQARTLVAHRWENEGEPLTVTAQFLDSTNVPDGFLPWLWAPVGLRFHALHHLLPSLPYHALGTAHRRISGALGTESTYARANYPTLRGLLGALFASTLKRSRA